ncbi:beta-propeller fold lactonase family protein [Mycolicibacterium confluentis]|uniref:hypothetical protein n=1 Tax=Mycolicibacterium confluentis TaxID=28047 RepID=UPI001055EDC6|nr:hypothetical protein [Mycolicibacterium confluentis]MCV7321395.1 hypothetical protein [Mycolicibacterium confluentis]
MANKVAPVDRVAGDDAEAARALPVLSPRLDRRPVSATSRAVEAVIAADAAVASDDVRAFAPVSAATIASGPITAMAELGGNLLTANYADDTLSLVARRGPRRAATVADVYEPFAIAVAGQRAYVTSVEPAYDTITVLERGEVFARIPVAGALRDVAVSPDGRRVYALQAADSAVLLGVIDAETHEVSDVELVVGPHTVPTALAVNPTNGLVYVAAVDHTSGVVMAVKDGRVAGAAPIPSMVRDIAVSRDGAVLVAVSDDDEFGGVIDFLDAKTLQITGTIELDGAAAQVSLSADGERAYVVSGDHVTVICTATRHIIDRIDAGVELSAALESSDGVHLFVSDNSGRVTTYEVNVTTNQAIAQIFDAAVIDVPMRELQAAGF